MYRGPRWKRRWRSKFRYNSLSNRSTTKKIFGGLLCLVGIGVILAAVPGWLYLLLFGCGIVFGGIWVMQ